MYIVLLACSYVITVCNGTPMFCWYRKPQECTGNKESEHVYDNPDDLTQWAHVAYNDWCCHVCMYYTHIGVHMNRWRWQNVLLTVLTNHVYTTDVYEQVTTTSYNLNCSAHYTTACMFAWHVHYNMKTWDLCRNNV